MGTVSKRTKKERHLLIVNRAGYARVVMLRFLQLHARVTLDDPAPTLAEAEAAAADGDESWEQWLAEYQRGEALIVRLEFSVEFSAGERDTLRVANPGVFIEKHPDPPMVEQQIAEVASKDFPFIVRDLTARGYAVDEGALSEMYVHVELQDDVRHALETGASTPRQAHRRSPEAEIGLSRTEELSTGDA